MRQQSRLPGVLVIAAVAVALCGVRVAEAAAKPNIVLIMADDLGYECLSCNGGGPYKTPVLDGLAKTGIRFTNAHAQPLCTPTRVELMTGLYNFRNYKVFGTLEKDQTTFGHILKKAGYATCIAGKWQLGRDRKLPKYFGFDEHCLWWLENPGARYMNPAELIRNGRKLTAADLKGRYGPDVCSNFLLDFITRHKDRPFFAYYPMILTHSPFQPTPDSRNPNSRRRKRNFVDMVQYTDKIIGRIVDRLKKLGLRENTVLLFLGDNGTGRPIRSTLDGRPIQGGKGTVKETGTHVPLIVNWPASKVRGKVIDDPVDLTDFLPTLVELTGAKLPPDIPFDGRSFAPQLRGEAGNPRKWIYFWYTGKGRQPGKEWVRGKRYKLYATGEFYDMARDPDQKQPLKAPLKDNAAANAHAELSAALKEMQRKRKLAKQ